MKRSAVRSIHRWKPGLRCAPSGLRLLMKGFIPAAVDPDLSTNSVVIPAKAGIQFLINNLLRGCDWTPAFAGVTKWVNRFRPRYNPPAEAAGGLMAGDGASRLTHPTGRPGFRCAPSGLRLLADGADVVIYCDAVFKQPKRKGPWRPDGKKKSRWVKVGERLVIAEVIEYAPEIDDWIYLRVLRIEGYEADDYRIKLERFEMETRKRRRNLRGLKRLAWTDEDVRARLVNDPQYSRFVPTE